MFIWGYNNYHMGHHHHHHHHHNGGGFANALGNIGLFAMGVGSIINVFSKKNQGNVVYNNYPQQVYHQAPPQRSCHCNCNSIYTAPSFNTFSYDSSMNLFAMPRVNNTFYYTPIPNFGTNNVNINNTFQYIQPPIQNTASLNNIFSFTSANRTSGASNTFTPNTTSTTGATRQSRPAYKYSSPNVDNLDANFLNKVKQVANNLNCDYKDLLALMNSESSLNSKAAYKNSAGKKTAVGLIQFTQPAITELNKKYGLNLTIDKVHNMSAIEQLDLTEKYLKIAKEYTFAENARLSAGDLYAITFLPGRANKEVLTTSSEDNYYSPNKGLDKNKDGKITKQDLSSHLAGKRVNESIFA